MTSRSAESILTRTLRRPSAFQHRGATLSSFRTLRTTGNNDNDNSNNNDQNNGINTTDDNLILADALNLIAPKAESSYLYNYKPSLVGNLTKGSAEEQYEQAKSTRNQQSKTKVDHQMKHLMEDLRVLYGVKPRSNYDVVDLPVAEIKKHARGLVKESQIVDLIKVLFYSDKLPASILIECMFNKNLRDLSQLPMDVMSLSYDFMVRNHWSKLNYIQFNVVLLKKLRDCGQLGPTVANLNKYFESRYLPAIIDKSLSPFYERIVWRVYFQHRHQLNQLYRQRGEFLDEFHYMHKLGFRSSLMIWQTSPIDKQGEIMQYIRSHFEPQLNDVQKLFVQLCNHNSVQTIIKYDWQHSPTKPHSSLLTDLKKLSIKHRLHTTPDPAVSLEHMDAKARSQLYVLCNSMQAVIEQMSRELQPADILQQVCTFKSGVLMMNKKKSTEDDNISGMAWSNWLTTAFNGTK